MEDFDRNKVMRILVNGITRNLDAYKDVDVILSGIEVNADLVVSITLDLNGTFLPLPVLKELSLVLGDDNLWVCSWGLDGLKISAMYKKSISDEKPKDYYEHHSNDD